MNRTIHLIFGITIALILHNVHGLAQNSDINHELPSNETHSIDGGHGRSKRFVYPPNSGIGVSKTSFFAEKYELQSNSTSLIKIFYCIVCFFNSTW